VDVSGESCSCVVIDRVPFDPPGDPLETRVAALMAGRLGVSEFLARSLPKACRVLAQAGGRLIRSESDRGVLVCLDSRVLGGWMGKHLTSSLPPFPVSRDPADVGNFLDRRPLTGLMSPPKPSAPVSVLKPRPRPSK
jgi:ATP-dependent DNA helicase DinG